MRKFAGKKRSAIRPLASIVVVIAVASGVVAGVIFFESGRSTTLHVSTASSSSVALLQPSQGNYTSYLRVSNPSVALSQGSVENCPVQPGSGPSTTCVLSSMGPLSEVYFNVLVHSSFGKVLEIPVQLEAYVTSLNGYNNPNSSLEQIGRQMVAINASGQQQVSMTLSLPSNAIDGQTTDLVATISFCSGPASPMCQFSNSTELFSFVFVLGFERCVKFDDRFNSETHFFASLSDCWSETRSIIKKVRLEFDNTALVQPGVSPTRGCFHFEECDSSAGVRTPAGPLPRSH
jgi:hypothetical protein